MKHGCGTRGAAPAFDTARRDDARGTLLPACPAGSCHVVFYFLFFLSQLELTELRLRPIRTELG